MCLYAGSLVPEDLRKAASMDGASPWKRFWMITVPLMKPAILVALLFRTLDAFRIFDSVFIISGSTHVRSVETVSILGYDELLNRLNLGLGSAVSVLVFVMVAIIAFIFVRGFNTSLAQQRGEV